MRGGDWWRVGEGGGGGGELEAVERWGEDGGVKNSSSSEEEEEEEEGEGGGDGAGHAGHRQAGGGDLVGRREHLKCTHHHSGYTEKSTLWGYMDGGKLGRGEGRGWCIGHREGEEAPNGARGHAEVKSGRQGR